MGLFVCWAEASKCAVRRSHNNAVRLSSPRRAALRLHSYGSINLVFALYYRLLSIDVLSCEPYSWFR